MFRQSTVLCVLGAFLLFGCEFPSKENFQTENPQVQESSFTNCMPYVHTARDEGDIPPPLLFVRKVSKDIFLCEYSRGAQMRKYGYFGPKLKVMGRNIFAGSGYAVADKTKGLAELLNKRDFVTFYSKDDVTFTVEENLLSIGGHKGPFARTFFVRVLSKYLMGSKTVAALGMFSFYEHGKKYQVFLWSQGYSLTKEEVRKNFRDMIKRITAIPSIVVAENR